MLLDSNLDKHKRTGHSFNEDKSVEGNSAFDDEETKSHDETDDDNEAVKATFFARARNK